MRPGQLFSFLFLLLPLLSFGQEVSGVRFEQAGQKVLIYYRLSAPTDVSVYISEDGGVTFSGPLVHVSGDVGSVPTAGDKRIVWDVLSDRESVVGDRICFRVDAGVVRPFAVGGVSFRMVKVQHGSFTMGATPEQQDPYTNEKPMHQVTLTKDYYLGETEVTQALWQAVMGKSLTQIVNEHGWSTYGVGDNYPMYYISWDDCQEFISKLNEMTGRTFRLPTEAEWEYAARGGSKLKGCQYSGSDNLGEVAWYSENSGSCTHPVATKQPNELGLYDMSGNVWEWCQDWYGGYGSAAQTNPTGPSSGSSRVYRGGGWNFNAWYCRASYRNRYNPVYRNYDLGLRLALSE